MLRYDHSSKILEGLFEPIVQVDRKGKPLKDTEDELKYRKNPVAFPTPGKGSVGLFSLSKAHSIGSLNIYNASYQYPFDYYLDGQTFTIRYEGTDYRLEPYYNTVNHKAYLGNAELLPSTKADPTWAGYSPEYSFVVIINDLYKDGEETHATPRVEFYAIYDETKDTITQEIGVTQHPEIKIYIGLFREKPDNFGTNFKEPGAEGSEDWWPEYLRLRLNTRSRFDKNINMLAPAKINEFGYAEIATQDMLLFPESVGNTDENIGDAEAGWGHISSFGLFYENTQYKTASTETLNFSLSEDKTFYTASLSINERPLKDQKYILAMTQITGFDKSERPLNKYKGKYTLVNNNLCIGSMEESSTPQKKYEGKINGDKIEFRISQTDFAKYADENDNVYNNIQMQIVMEHESLPFLWGDIKGKDDDGNETDGVDLERYQVPVIRKSGLTFTLK